MASIAEYFTLSDASATAARIPDVRRKEIADALAIGRQKAEAAEALWSNGHAAEGLRLAVEALVATLEAAPRYGSAVGAAAAPKPAAAAVAKPAPAPEKKAESDAEKAEKANDAEASDAEGETSETADAKAEEAAPLAADPEPTQAEVEAKAEAEAALDAAPPVRDWRAVLAERGVKKDAITSIGEAESKARAATLPRLDGEVSPAHSDLYEQIVRARSDVDRALAYAAMSPRELAWARFARIATATSLTAIVLVALYFTMRTPTAITAEASDVFAGSPTFQAQHIVDGNPATEWLLPDRATGWVEARLSPPRHVARVSLTNARNPPHFDRGTREYRLELYAGGQMVHSIDGSFERFERDPQPVAHDVDFDGVERVRFVVRSFHNLGPGLAEMQIEE